jgi:aspartyl/asparaginyl beta-hydroxylase (cupin superfamily)
VLRDPAAFSPYITLDANSPYSGFAGMANKPDWSSFYLYKDGMRVAENVARCPKTLEALERVPLCVMPGRGPSALFSWLLPGARIPPHCGIMNTTLICHLPLIVPGNCGFRVGAETREWRFGQGWAFDDTFEHEAWNRSRELRVILIFDIWRPDITVEERELICAMWSAVDGYNVAPSVLES